MSLRSIEVFCPSTIVEDVREVLSEEGISTFRTQTLGEDLCCLRFIIESDDSKDLVKMLDKRWNGSPHWHLIISPIQGMIPTLVVPKKEEEEDEKEEKKDETIHNRLVRIPLQELYSQVEEGVSTSPNTYILFVLSAVVAAIGLLQDNVSIIIGSMVIAPFLGPNVGLALGTTLGDLDLIKKSTYLLLSGIALVFGVSLFRGWIDPGVSSLGSAATINYSLIVVAFVSGITAILSLMRGAAAILVGVMVAVALLPPLVLCGLLIGGGLRSPALNAFLLFAANVVGLNLGGVLTFWVAGIKPTQRWEAKKASKHTIRATFFRSLSLLILVVATYFLSL